MRRYSKSLPGVGRQYPAFLKIDRNLSTLCGQPIYLQATNLFCEILVSFWLKDGLSCNEEEDTQL